MTGAFTLIGLRYGMIRVEDEQRREKAHSLAKEFAREFKSRNGSITCRELLDCDISTYEGMKLAEEVCVQPMRKTTRLHKISRD
ncbi:MAG: C-GCAxxG-C-C family protein [Euryarchaeota archaeon]|nr:C-GCAxxG-C-C family protein [Euryarchaeota archaeon]